ncbi:MAG: cytochrome c family protein [candidate division KSB1 bacterium]|nr:cytochrome c family protein [candidate division KSB1 bacterium]
MRKIAAAIGLALVLAIAGAASYSQQKAFQYVGVTKCKMCHQLKARGEQFQKWQASPHAKAYEVLATEQAKSVASKAGVQGDPQKAAECLKCHVTAYDAPASAKSATYKMEEGVTCEACHGPGSEYFKMNVMKDLYEGKIQPATVGMIVPDEKLCKTCHNEKSPTYKPFTYQQALAKIAHPVPKQ